nr:hypothetical protein RVX_3149 [Nitratidesulfovibrio sp. HK-II]
MGNGDTSATPSASCRCLPGRALRHATPARPDHVKILPRTGRFPVSS